MIDSGNDLSLVWQHTITVDLLLTGPLGILKLNFNENTIIFIEANAKENVVCKMPTILFQPDVLSQYYVLNFPVTMTSIAIINLVMRQTLVDYEQTYFKHTIDRTMHHSYGVIKHNLGPTFIKPDQLDPWIKDQLRNALLSTILSLQLPNFVSCGRACPSHMTQNSVTLGAKLLTGEWFSFDPWSMEYTSLKQKEPCLLFYHH